ncbi:MAG: (2Fe-2S) ferredoxin domain-containing protein [Cyanobacteriota bacterium]
MNSPETSRQVLVCTNRSCRKQGAAKVLTAFQELSVTDVTVKSSGCLGECGNGPMVLVTPDQIWYSAVHPQEVPAVVERHLQEGRPVGSMLYPKYHRPISGLSHNNK